MRPFYKFTYRIFGWYMDVFHHNEVYGQENLIEGGALIAANHASFYDPVVVGASCPEEICFMARGSLFNQPVFRTFIESMNAHPVAGGTQDLSSLKLICQLIGEGNKVLVFPEGTRSHQNVLLPFKKGLAVLASQSNCPIIPTYIHGAYDAWPRGNLLPKPWGKTACIFGEPLVFDPKLHKNKKDLYRQIIEETYGAIFDLRDWYEKGATGPLPSSSQKHHSADSDTHKLEEG